MITVSGVSLAEIRGCNELIEKYAAECVLPVLGNPNPQWEMYEQMQAVGALVCFGVYAGNEMVGFATVLVSILPHYGTKSAMVESMFVDERYRKHGAGNDLMEAVEREAKRLGCKAIVYTALAGGRLEAILGKRYARTGASYCKSLS